MWFSRICGITTLLVTACILFVVGNCTRLGFGSKCIKNARQCTHSRLRYHGGLEMRAIFQDAIYHYCLDLYGCEDGKEQVCHNVGKSEHSYPDPIMRRRLVQQCELWKIPIKLVGDEGPLGHYPYFKDE